MRKIVWMAVLLLLPGLMFAQNSYNLKKEDFGDGLFKVKSGNCYGIFDKNDNVIVSVEYEDIVLSDDGIAVLKKNDDCVYGSVSAIGTVANFEKEFKLNPEYPYYADGCLLVKYVGESRDKWFYVDNKGKRIGKLNLLPTSYFKSAMPFSEGYASVVNQKGKMMHIDKNGEMRYIIENENVLFRTSVKNDESIIFSDSGIKVYQEDRTSHKANVKMVLASSCSDIRVDKYSEGIVVKFNEGTLYLDSYGCAEKYVPRKGDEISFVRPEVLPEETAIAAVPEPEVLDIKNELTVSLKQKVVSSSSKGYAGVTVIIGNNSKINSGPLTVVIKSDGIRPKESSMQILASETQDIKFSLPAKFSDAEKTQDIIVEISDGTNAITKRLSVTLKRYEASDILL